MRTVLRVLVVLVVTGGLSSAAGFPDIDGWQPAGEVRTYDASNLWEYINGAADAFMMYGFEQLQVRDVSAGGVTVTANIYDMGTPLNAFGIYRAESPKGVESLDVGVEVGVGELGAAREVAVRHRLAIAYQLTRAPGRSGGIHAFEVAAGGEAHAYAQGQTGRNRSWPHCSHRVVHPALSLARTDGAGKQGTTPPAGGPKPQWSAIDRRGQKGNLPSIRSRWMRTASESIAAMPLPCTGNRSTGPTFGILTMPTPRL